MLFESGFSVPAAADDVFALMLDIPQVAGCLPGATVGEPTENGGREATIAVKVGPIRLTYGGAVRVFESDPAARTASLSATVREQRGQGTAQATISMRVAEGEGGQSQVSVTTELMVTGRVAQMGQGIMQDVAARMIGDMARNMEAALTPAGVGGEAAGEPAPAQTKPIKGFSLALGVLWDRIRRLFRRGR